MDLFAKTGVSPDLVAVGGLFFGVRHKYVHLRLSALHSFGETLPTRPGSASFSWTAGLLRACPFPQNIQTLTLEACGSFEVGVLTGTGQDVPNAASARFLWMAPGLAGHARWGPLPSLFFELDASGFVPLVPVHFLLKPSTTVWNTPAVGSMLGGGVGIVFL
jgi:hypothetical protein